MVLEKVKAILSEQFDVEEDSITPDTNLSEDLEADSLDVVDLLMSIEDEGICGCADPKRRCGTDPQRGGEQHDPRHRDRNRQLPRLCGQGCGCGYRVWRDRGNHLYDSIVHEKS